MKRPGVVALMACMALAAEGWPQKPPLLPEKDIAVLANELSGETAKRNLEGIARFHRQRGSQGFHAAAELVAERLRAYGLGDAAILQFPADGKIFYGTQRSRPAWDAQAGNLGELWLDPKWCEEPAAKQDATARDKKTRPIRFECSPKETTLGSFEAEPVVLAEDSESGEATTNLVDVGEGTKESDYAGKEVQGNIVLASAQPGAVQDLAVGKFHAAGIVSYAQNQKTAWWGENENLIRWGHLETFSASKTWAFMVSLKTARGFRDRLAKGEKIMLHAVVKAGQHPGNYEVVTATIPGADSKLKEEEIAFSCHLDHQRPGANDNASGCVTILEVARTLQKLIAEGKLARPARTIRFIFPPEIEGTLTLLNGKPVKILSACSGQPENIVERCTWQDPVLAKGAQLAPRIKAVVHMDMVGGGPETKAVFHVTRGPMSLPSFVHDVAWAFAEWLNEESYQFAATGKADYLLVAPEGGKEPLRAEYSAYTMGSDHDVYQDSSFAVPAIYLNDWPDRYIHTNFDSAANIDPTKLKRAAFIGAASAYFLARLSPNDKTPVEQEVTIGRFERDVFLRERLHSLPPEVACVLMQQQIKYESDSYRSWGKFMGGEATSPNVSNLAADKCAPVGFIPEPRVSPQTFKRKSSPRGPLSVFGYDYFADHAKAAGVTTPRLLSYEGLWGSGEEYAYEVLNFADGKRNAQDIRDAVSAEYGPVPLEMVVEYLKALEKIGIVEAVK